MARAQAEDHLVPVVQAALGGVHGVRVSVFVIRADDEYRQGMKPGVVSEIFSHCDSPFRFDKPSIDLKAHSMSSVFEKITPCFSTRIGVAVRPKTSGRGDRPIQRGLPGINRRTTQLCGGTAGHEDRHKRKTGVSHGTEELAAGGLAETGEDQGNISLIFEY